MTFRTHSDILPLAKIPLNTIAVFCLATADTERDEIAKSIHTQYGADGLHTLWMCQGFECSTRSVSVKSPETKSLTRASNWWLTADTSETAAMKSDLAQVLDQHDANRLLGMCARTPQLNLQSPESNTMFAPGDCEDTESLLSAFHVRRLAQTYFPHLPIVASPMNHLYTQYYELADADKTDPEDPEKEWGPIYSDPLGAFIDDPHALKYFAMSNGNMPQNPPDWLLDFVKDGDSEWNVYKTLGIPMEQAYALAVANAQSAKEALPLPEDVALSHS